MKEKVVGARVDKEVYEKLREVAKKRGINVSVYLEGLINRALYEDKGESEVIECLNNVVKELEELKQHIKRIEKAVPVIMKYGIVKKKRGLLK